MSKAAPCGPARSGRGGCTTRPRCGPRASPTCSGSTRGSGPKSTPGTAARPKRSPHRVRPPPLKPKKDAAPEETAAYEERRHQQSSERICVEHANAEHKQWRPLQRYLGRREDFEETFLAISGLVSDRAAER